MLRRFDVFSTMSYFQKLEELMTSALRHKVSLSLCAVRVAGSHRAEFKRV